MLLAKYEYFCFLAYLNDPNLTLLIKYIAAGEAHKFSGTILNLFVELSGILKPKIFNFN